MTDQNQVEGILQIADERHDGQLRDPINLLRPLNGGVIVAKKMIEEMRLRPGLLLKGMIKGRHLNRVAAIEKSDPSDYTDRVSLYEGTAVDPYPMVKLEHNPTEFITRAIDILSPIGFGQ